VELWGDRRDGTEGGVDVVEVVFELVGGEVGVGDCFGLFWFEGGEEFAG